MARHRRDAMLAASTPPLVLRLPRCAIRPETVNQSHAKHILVVAVYGAETLGETTLYREAGQKAGRAICGSLGSAAGTIWSINLLWKIAAAPCELENQFAAGLHNAQCPRTRGAHMLSARLLCKTLKPKP